MFFPQSWYSLPRMDRELMLSSDFFQLRKLRNFSCAAWMQLCRNFCGRTYQLKLILVATSHTDFPEILIRALRYRLCFQSVSILDRMLLAQFFQQLFQRSQRFLYSSEQAYLIWPIPVLIIVFIVQRILRAGRMIKNGVIAAIDDCSNLLLYLLRSAPSLSDPALSVNNL